MSVRFKLLTNFSDVGCLLLVILTLDDDQTTDGLTDTLPFNEAA